ncbi:MAG: alginate lyase family protein [Steroidobacteraceae bacterium]
MSPAEIPHRAWRALAAQAGRFGLRGRAGAPGADLATPAAHWVHLPANADPTPYFTAADRIAAGRLDVLSLEDFAIGAVPRWNRDPKTGIEAPLSFGTAIDYRDAELVGDIKYLWEPNRHLHLVTLAQAIALGGGERHAQVLRGHLESWFTACPYRMGPNWTSALEAALRLVNWAIAWQLAGGVRSTLFAGGDGAAFRERWLRSIHQHARFVRGHLSLHSSANNHLIGEAAGLFIAGVTWPHWREALHWRTRAAAILARETLRQNAPDGVNREQAVSYQQFELDLLLMALLAGRAGGIAFPPQVAERLAAMCEYLASIMDAGGNVPMIGDSDDGFAVRLAPAAGFCRYRSALAGGGLLLGRDDFRVKAGATDDKTHWLFGADAERDPLPPAGERRPLRQAFPDGGQYVLGCDFESSREIRLVADAGPLGYLSIAAHGHADALSFTLSVGGSEILIDPGTYTYHTEPEWRRYFRGTAAHNTVCVDGQDQSEQGGNFLWLRKATTTCHRWQSDADTDLLDASHDGYARLADPVMHRRLIRLDKQARRIRIDDLLQMSGAHDVELHFHCAEACRLKRLPDGFLLLRDGVAVALRLPVAPAGRIDVRRGGTAPILGWASRRYGVKAPTHTITWRARITGHCRLQCELAC